MNPQSLANSHSQIVTNYHDWVSTTFSGDVNAIGWERPLQGDFAEIVRKVKGDENIIELIADDLLELELSEQGKLAREVLLADLKLLTDHGASPTLNLIKYYERDETHPFFPTDVYSFHADRAPIPTDTILCTYYGESSEIVSNAQAEQKIHIRQLREKLREHYTGSEAQFESYLREYSFDLHYEANPDATITQLGVGMLWRLAVDYPGSPVLPCIHRAPVEKQGQRRLLLIC